MHSTDTTKKKTSKRPPAFVFSCFLFFYALVSDCSNEWDWRPILYFFSNISVMVLCLICVSSLIFWLGGVTGPRPQNAQDSFSFIGTVVSIIALIAFEFRSKKKTFISKS